ncbi:MAG: hypothetical protein ACSW8I_04275 [bacterium]
MSLTEWIKTDYGLAVDLPDACEGVPLAQTLYRALVAAGADYSTQKRLLYEASGRLHDLAFGTTCLDLIADIDAFERRRGDLRVAPVRKCHSGVHKNKDWQPGAEYAELRFSAARHPDSDLLDAVDDMLRLLIGEGYVESRPDVLRDLRQGLGYYRPDEDILRRRRTVKWLRGQNALHCWIVAMLSGRSPLIRVGDGAPGCWVTAASLFVDRHSRAFTYARLEHGVLRNALQRQWIEALVPKSPQSP